MVWSDDVGGVAAKAFWEGEAGEWLNYELELAGDELTGTQIAAVFSIVTGRPMHYRRGPPSLLLRCISREGYMHTRCYDDGHVAYQCS